MWENNTFFNICECCPQRFTYKDKKLSRLLSIIGLPLIPCLFSPIIVAVCTFKSSVTLCSMLVSFVT